jgi:hypothetical protein
MVDEDIPDSFETSSNDICFLVLRDLILSPISFWSVMVFSFEIDVRRNGSFFSRNSGKAFNT